MTDPHLVDSIVAKIAQWAFTGMTLKVVDAGTEITDGETKLIVSDRRAVAKGTVIHVTQPVYDAVKLALPGKPSNDNQL